MTAVKRFTPLIVLLGLVTAVFWILFDKGEIGLNSGVKSPAPSLGEQSPALLGPKPGATAGAQKLSARQGLVAAAAVAPPANSKSYGSGFILRTVRKETLEAIPEVEISVLNPHRDSGNDLSDTFDEQRDYLRVLWEAGTTYRTDKNGEVILPWPEDYRYLVIADSEEWFAMDLDLYPAVEGITLLELQPATTVTLLAVDQQGAPLALIPAVIQIEGAHFQSILMRKETDPDGLAVFANPDTPIRASGWNNPDMSIVAGLDILAPVPPSQLLDSNNLPIEPVRLVVPQTGKVEVTVIDSWGRPMSENNLLMLGIGEDVDTFYAPSMSRMTAKVVGGIARFELIGLGQTLTAEIIDNENYNGNSITFGGPVTVGEVVSVVLVGGGPPRMAKAQLLVDGVQLYETALEVTIAGTYTANGNRFRRRLYLETNPLGMVEFDLPSIDEARLIEATFKSEHHGSQSSAVSLDGIAEEGVCDLGQVTISFPPVLVSGRVVDQNGEPIHRAEVAVEKLEVLDEDSLFSDDGPPPGSFYEEVWERDWRLSDTTDEHGKFQIRSNIVAGKYRLAAWGKKWQILFVPFTPGDSGLEAILIDAGIVEGSLILPKRVVMDDIELELDYLGGTGGDWDSSNSAWELSGDKFRFTQLPAGNASLLVKLDGFDEELTRIDNIELDVGEVNRDPRLQRIDLRELINVARIRVFDPDGRSLEWVRIKADHPSGSTTFRFSQLTHLVFPNGALDLEINSHGYRTVTLNQVSGDQDVVLHPGVGVEVEVLGLEYLSGDLGIEITIIPIREGGMFRWERHELENSKTTLTLEPGTYRVSLRIASASGSRLLSEPGLLIESEFVVVDRHGHQVVLEADVEHINEALQQLETDN